MKRSLLYLLICMVFIITLNACAKNEVDNYVTVGDQAPFNEHRVPNYPGAQGMHVRGDGATSGGGSRFIYFTTGDPPTSVLSFYSEMLPKEGWLLPKEPEAMPGDLYFYCCEESSSSPEYQVTVSTLTLDMAATHVTVALTFIPR
ncbi:MAG TPA: hypothetical protein VJ183_13270 [Chloroflexia bacterium]|nr:hypothetical protein [Chloroflexia bacterium]